jgi:acyl transferase domain-containing protein
MSAVRSPTLSAFARKLQRRTTEPIAIVGLGCRFPMAPSPEAFARALASGTSAIREIPRERWNIDAYYSPVQGTPGTMCTRHGGFIDGVDLFDAAFFGISPREAEAMDPQQRLLLEVAWETLESTGIPKDALARSQTGVFIGLSAIDYGFFLGEQQVDGYTNTGLALSVAAGRLSSFFDLRGPSEVIDTACSGSLVAVHRACESLRAHETDAALAGGVSLLLHPMLHIGFSQAGMLARDGRCKTFDARADGYTRGEGCGLLLLKRLSDAQHDGDTIHALITGSAINHNGRGTGLTAPNGPAQEELIARALMMSGRDAAADRSLQTTENL